MQLLLLLPALAADRTAVIVRGLRSLDGAGAGQAKLLGKVALDGLGLADLHASELRTSGFRALGFRGFLF